jgi:sugar/nucleoside kinase (ribokinase family)
LLDAYLEEVQSFLKSKCEGATVVVMPDFFLDRFVSLDWDVKSFSEMIANVVERKGGSIDGIFQTEFRGGNAINTASALASLGLKVTPIVCTDKLGLRLISFYLKMPRIDLSHIKVFNKMSITTALEFETKNGKANVMLRDLGSLADFGPKDLSIEDFEAVENADYVCIFNWAGTRNFGTALAETVFRHVKTKGRGETYFDTADPTPNKEKVQDLMKKVLQASLIDVLSLNENEAIFYASQLSDKIKELKGSLNFEDLAKESARILTSHISARIDLHTTRFSATFTKNGETIVPAFQVHVLRATGAGDAWNAGNILGGICGLSDAGRLALANAVAAYYISNPKGAHPTRKELIRFCNKLKGKWITKTDKN